MQTLLSDMSVPFEREPCPRTAIHLTQAQYDELKDKQDLYTMETFDGGLNDPVMIGNNDKVVYSLQAMLKHLNVDQGSTLIGNNLNKKRKMPLNSSRTFNLSNVQAVSYERPDGWRNSEQYNATESLLTRLTGMTEQERMLTIDMTNDFEKNIGMTIRGMTAIVTDFLDYICSQTKRNFSIRHLELAEKFRDFADSQGKYKEGGQTTSLITKTISTVWRIMSKKIIPHHRADGFYILNPVTVQEFTEKLNEFCDLHEEVESYTIQSLIDKFKLFLDNKKIAYNGNNDKFFESMFISAADDRRQTAKIQVFNTRITDDATGRRAIVKTYLVANNMVSGSFSLH
jgi:hypothetical protein